MLMETVYSEISIAIVIFLGMNSSLDIIVLDIMADIYVTLILGALLVLDLCVT